MTITLENIGVIIDNVGGSIIKYPDNIKSLMYSYRFQNRVVSSYMKNLEGVVSSTIGTIEDEKLSKSLNSWLESIKMLKAKPSDKKAWMKYFTVYQRVIEVSIDILRDSEKDILEDMDGELPAESGSYLLQSISLARDVFLYFHKFTDKAKEGAIPVSISSVSEDLVENFINFSSDIKELITFVNEGKELEDKFIDNTINLFSSVNLSLMKAYTSLNVPIESKHLSEDAEVVLSGYINK